MANTIFQYADGVSAGMLLPCCCFPAVAFVLVFRI